MGSKEQSPESLNFKNYLTGNLRLMGLGVWNPRKEKGLAVEKVRQYSKETLPSEALEGHQVGLDQGDDWGSQKCQEM